MNLSRRDFIKKGSLSLLALYLAGPLGLLDWEETPQAFAATSDNVLVVIQLSGGNDGLNTVIPYSIGEYYDNRPGLAIAQKNVLALNNQFGLHPSLSGLKKLYDQKKVAIINGVGYPNPNRSHFRSMEIWQTADPKNIGVSTGWLGRYLDVTQSPKNNPITSLTVGSQSKIYLAQKHDVPTIDDVAYFQLLLKNAMANEREQQLKWFRQMYRAAGDDPTLQLVRAKGTAALNASDLVQAKVKSTQPSKSYPTNSKFATKLQLIAQFIASGIGSRTYFTDLGGFDDHAREQGAHTTLLRELDGALSAFYADLTARKVIDRVTILVYSEFGRRVKENASAGTDHGTAAPVLVIGGKVKGGLYGQLPSLTQLDNGDLKYTVDFRSVYATLLNNWLKAPAKDILGGTFENLKFI